MTTTATDPDDQREALLQALAEAAPGQAGYYASVLDAGAERGYTAVQALFDMGLGDVAEAAVWAHLGVEVQTVAPNEVDLDAFGTWGPATARARRAVPLSGKRLLAEDPGDPELVRLARSILGEGVVMVAPAGGQTVVDELIAWAEEHFVSKELADAAAEATATVSVPVVALDDASSTSEVAQLVDDVLRRAVEQRASDVHIEPMPSALVVRYRVDGVLRSENYPAKLAPAVVARLKVMARVDIAQARRPADGRFSFSVTPSRDQRSGKVDCRLVTLPSVWGESATVRLLGTGAGIVRIEQLGFSPPVASALRSALASPTGALFVTGPTGSGKTTTLYSVLSTIATAERKVLTIEDPVEQRIEGVSQHQVDPAAGFTFATALRSFLRADPDVIMVGEIRDKETAEMAVAAAYTGHFVLSSFHASSAALAPLRLMDMGIPAALVASGLHVVIAQRLVRKLCTACRVPDEARYDSVLEWPGSDGLMVNERPKELWTASDKGCKRCVSGGKGGHIGRVAIAEVLVVDEAVRRAIVDGAPPEEIRRYMKDQGTGSMWADGLAKVAAGETSMAELARVTEQQED
jgi:type II secretory ATPase GspE/PulE/Tfp pilus assembly ATPase PilB-like protein